MRDRLQVAGAKPEPAPTIPRCARCSVLLLHDVLFFTAQGLGGTSHLCCDCTQAALDALNIARVEAAAALEQLWGLE